MWKHRRFPVTKAVLKRAALQTPQDWNPNCARARATEASLAQVQSRLRHESKGAKDSELVTQPQPSDSQQVYRKQRLATVAVKTGYMYYMWESAARSPPFNSTSINSKWNLSLKVRPEALRLQEDNGKCFKIQG